MEGEVFSIEEKQIIAANPLGSKLEDIRQSLEEVEHPFLYSKNPRTETEEGDTKRDVADALTDIVLALAGHPVAKKIELKWNGKQLGRELGIVYFRLRDDGSDLSLFQPLITIIRDKASDLEIWTAVLEIIKPFSPDGTAIKPYYRSIAATTATFGGTPWKRSSGSLSGSNQTSEILKKAIKEDELQGCVYKNVKEFYTKYFEGKSWSDKCEKAYNAMKKDWVGGYWRDLSNAPNEAQLWEWLLKFQDNHLQGSPNRYFTTKSKAEVRSREREFQLDIGVERRSLPPAADGRHDISNLLVLGEHTALTDQWTPKLLQQAVIVRDLFAHQYTRRFVHGFIILGSTLQLWIYDHSGVYGSELLNIHKEPKRFITILTAYAWMSNEELGMDTFITQGPYFDIMTITDEEKDADVSFKLKKRPIAFQRGIVCRSTVCFQTTDGKSVVKFSWQSNKRRPEQENLQAIQKYSIKGVPTLLGSREVTTIAHHREGLTFSQLHNFKIVPSQSRPSSSTSVTRDLQSPTLCRSTKQKRDTSNDDGEPIKRIRSSSSKSKLSRQMRPNSPPPNADSDEKVDEDSEKFSNRVLTCLVTSPAGRALKDVSSPLELLETLRDAIKAHKSLLLDAHMLHRDISDNNIIIANPKDNNGMTGLLIDYDLAVQVDKDFKNEKTRAEFFTGTLKFMAIEVLRAGCRDPKQGIDNTEFSGLDRTYRHDLESFFYVLLSVCISNDKDKYVEAEEEDPLRAWCVGKTQEIARTKTGDMVKYSFEFILASFSPKFDQLKDVARRLWRILFIDRARVGELDVTTPKCHPSLFYDEIIGALNTAIRQII